MAGMKDKISQLGLLLTKVEADGVEAKSMAERALAPGRIKEGLLELMGTEVDPNRTVSHR